MEIRLSVRICLAGSSVAKEDNGNETHRLVEGHPRSEGVEALIARAVDAPLMADQPQPIQDRFARELQEISEVMGV